MKITTPHWKYCKKEALCRIERIIHFSYFLLHLADALSWNSAYLWDKVVLPLGVNLIFSCGPGLFQWHHLAGFLHPRVLLYFPPFSSWNRVKLVSVSLSMKLDPISNSMTLSFPYQQLKAGIFAHLLLRCSLPRKKATHLKIRETFVKF